MTETAATADRRHPPEAGNTFVFIFGGILLFGLLMFYVGRSIDGAGRSAIGRGDVKLAATAMTAHARDAGRGAQRLLTRGISESDLSFHSDAWGHALYLHTPAADPGAQLFHAQGGAVRFMAPPQGTADTYFFTGANIKAEAGDTAIADLVMIAADISLELCTEINRLAGVSTDDGAPPQIGAPAQTGPGTGAPGGTPPDLHFIGTFSGTHTISGKTAADRAALEPAPFGCFEGDTQPPAGSYHFYYVLHARD